MDIKKRDNKTFILKTRNKIVKIPYSFGSWKEIERERKCISQIKNDSHFSNYLLDYKYFLGCPITKYIHPVKMDDELAKEYFKKAFWEINSWRSKEIKYLVEAGIFLNFVLGHAPSHYKIIKDFLASFKMPCSSAHGDFNKDNILNDNGQLYFIDWSRYGVESSRHFDLIDFYIFSKKKSNQSWIEVWENMLGNPPKEIFGINIYQDYFYSYGIWKVTHELNSLKSLKLLNRYKRKKYIRFIDIFIKFIQKDL